MADIDKLLQAEIAGAAETEWRGTLGGTELVLRAKPICPAEIAIVERKFPDFSTKGGAGGMVAMIILKARDENGNKVFQSKHQDVLARVSIDKIGDIFKTLFGDQVTGIDDETHEEAVGN